MKLKLGHQAPSAYQKNKFNSIEINGDLAYCKSHNFLYNAEDEERKLYDGLACYYTDSRFVDGLNFYKNTYIHWTRHETISLKACIRKILSCRNIPIGTIVNFNQSWYYPGKKIENFFNFKIKKENKFEVDYQINIPSYFDNFTNCNFSQELTNELRKNGFIVSVKVNRSLLKSMINTAVLYTGKNDFIDNEIEGEVAVAYGHGKIIGFSSFNNDYLGYSSGCDNILFDKFGEFDKWSRCNEIPKTSLIEEIINILKS